jgi:hypothetical protein
MPTYNYRDLISNNSTTIIPIKAIQDFRNVWRVRRDDAALIHKNQELVASAEGVLDFIDGVHPNDINMHIIAKDKLCFLHNTVTDDIYQMTEET